MTDNRTNEPTEAQVEAALAAREAHKGAWVDEFKEMVCPECGWCYMTEHERKPDNKPSNEVVYARVDAHRMRAALVAAQGAAPQAESADCDRDRMGICKRCGMGWDARKVLDGDFACPVLPSSGVDEVRAEAVREVARYINRIAPNGLVPKKMILADMEFAADRLGRGIHANGNDRAVQGGESRGE